MKKIYKWLSYEQQRFEMDAIHIHDVSGDGKHVIFGNGFTIMRVIKPTKNYPNGTVVFVGHDGVDEYGRPFNYSDYFLPEEIADE